MANTPLPRLSTWFIDAPFGIQNNTDGLLFLRNIFMLWIPFDVKIIVRRYWILSNVCFYNGTLFNLSNDNQFNSSATSLLLTIQNAPRSHASNRWFSMEIINYSAVLSIQFLNVFPNIRFLKRQFFLLCLSTACMRHVAVLNKLLPW